MPHEIPPRIGLVSDDTWRRAVGNISRPRRANIREIAHRRAAKTLGLQRLQVARDAVATDIAPHPNPINLRARGGGRVREFLLHKIRGGSALKNNSQTNDKKKDLLHDRFQIVRLKLYGVCPPFAKLDAAIASTAATQA